MATDETPRREPDRTAEPDADVQGSEPEAPPPADTEAIPLPAARPGPGAEGVPAMDPDPDADEPAAAGEPAVPHPPPDAAPAATTDATEPLTDAPLEAGPAERDAGVPAEPMAAGLGGAAAMAEAEGVEAPAAGEPEAGVPAEPMAAGLGGAAAIAETGRQPLVGQPGGYRARWEDIQAAFVDEPRAAVEDADQIVVEVVDEVAAVLTRQREEIAEGWRHDPDASTEDLRQTFRRYRTLLDQLLSV